ncbi:pyridoxamine 5'-phosphate oxidase family protein [Colwellia echini]|uniref:General stress protein n=1 Tax=Colwellia echini TaxID=1982103 RepID=A0ABY3N0R0_9GAMM|nr:pyridoxamine 5'-phosphate oxidase family protein [Colwellia echini]TYK67078.1 general stress protein [Colwellia echini]
MSSKITQQMWEEIAESPYLMLSLSRSNEHSEPMRAQLDKNANNCFWFYTTKDNRIASGGNAMAQFVSKDHKLFACISGNLIEEVSSTIIDKFWSKGVEAWYQDGKEDPSLKMMRFELLTAEIWTVEPSVTGMLKLATGVTIKASEMGEHENLAFK